MRAFRRFVVFMTLLGIFITPSACKHTDGNIVPTDPPPVEKVDPLIDGGILAVNLDLDWQGNTTRSLRLRHTAVPAKTSTLFINVGGVDYSCTLTQADADRLNNRAIHGASLRTKLPMTAKPTQYEIHGELIIDAPGENPPYRLHTISSKTH